MAMKKYCISLWVALFFVLEPLLAQNYNYIISRTYKNGVASEANDVSKTTTQVQYLDGLGRPIQSVTVGQSPMGKDIITHQTYDAFGRESNQFLPFTDTNTGATGAFRTNAATLQSTFYSSNIPQLAAGDLGRPFQETTFESSPLNRVVAQLAPGNKSNSSTVEYLVNKGTSGLLAVKRYDFQENAVLTQTVALVGYYPDDRLNMVKTIDEEGKVMLEAKDKEGKIVLKRALVDGSTYADTYYVYDDLGRLRAMLQPNYQTEANAGKYAFLYRYDNRGRLIEKQVPGAESVEMRYDQFDRLVLSRDGNQRANNKWSFTKYDAFNRTIMTGEIPDNLAPTETALLSNVHHETLTGTGNVKYSLNVTLPSSISESHVLTVTYYDDYNSWGALSYSNPYGISNETSLKGSITGVRTRVINSDNSYSSSFLVQTTYYDINYRPIQTAKELFSFTSGERILRTSTKYKHSVAAVVEREREEQETEVGKVKIEKVYTYDQADEIMSVTHQIWLNDAARPQVTLSGMNYNELGQLSAKWLHSADGTSFRRKTAYTYNIRGWQTEGKTQHKQEGQTNEQTQFGYQLAYETGAAKYTNGNIGSITWNHAAIGNLPVINGAYTFVYDGLNRLKSTGSAGGTNEGGIDYDLNGNIKLLKRWKAGLLIDDLNYDYPNGNRLNGIVDNSANADGFKEAATGGLGSYAYDANGNLTKDLNKGIQAEKINYNLLNLIRRIEIGSNSLDYYYDATGQKHRLIYTNSADATKNEDVRYAGSVEYQSTSIKRITTGEGQVIFIPSSGGGGLGVESYQYYLSDHLGNTRAVVTGQGEILQRADYYAFGLTIEALDRSVNKYTYNGKELQPEVNLLDYGARMYGAAEGRFFTIDPLGDKFAFQTSFAYAGNSPVNLIDNDGLGPGLPPTKVYRTMYSADRHFVEALYYANNTSNQHFYDWVRLKRTSDFSAQGKFIGAAGEAVALERLTQTSPLSFLSINFGIPQPDGNGNEYQTDVTAGLHGDALAFATRFGNHAIAIKNYDFSGSQKSSAVFEAKQGFKYFRINYEVKALSAKTSTGKIFDKIQQGIFQTILRGGVSSQTIGVLIVDKDAWSKVAKSKKYGAELRILYNTLIESGNFLRLEQNLFQEAKQRVENLKNTVQSTNP